MEKKTLKQKIKKHLEFGVCNKDVEKDIDNAISELKKEIDFAWKQLEDKKWKCTATYLGFLEDKVNQHLGKVDSKQEK